MSLDILSITFISSLTCNFIVLGCQFGTVVTMVMTGWLCETQYGWPSVFYLFGSLGLVWSLLWFPLVQDKPPAGTPGIVPEDADKVSIRSACVNVIRN